MMMIVRAVRARLRLSIGTLCGIVAYLLLPATNSTPTRGILAWDFGCLVFLTLAAQMFTSERRSSMADDAARQEEGEWTIFGLSVGAVGASIAGIISIYSDTKGVSPDSRAWHIGLVALTLLLTFLMTHTLFALRYAHEYYAIAEPGGDPDGGLNFPEDRVPDYWDFFYFALVLGMTFQVSDVQITSTKLRRLATAHALLSFVYNTAFIALTVNLGASLLG
jgi:uncharacterized membrane protein